MLGCEGRGEVVPLSASARVEPQGFGSPAGREDESERSMSPLHVCRTGIRCACSPGSVAKRPANDLANVKDKLIEGGCWSNSAVPFFLNLKNHSSLGTLMLAGDTSKPRGASAVVRSQSGAAERRRPCVGSVYVFSAGVAQSVEHLFCKQKVRGSSPLSSSGSSKSLLVNFPEGCPSGQWEQAVNLPELSFVGSNPTPSTSKQTSMNEHFSCGGRSLGLLQ